MFDHVRAVRRLQVVAGNVDGASQLTSPMKVVVQLAVGLLDPRATSPGRPDRGARAGPQRAVCAAACAWGVEPGVRPEHHVEGGSTAARGGDRPGRRAVETSIVAAAANTDALLPPIRPPPPPRMCPARGSRRCGTPARRTQPAGPTWPSRSWVVHPDGATDRQPRRSSAAGDAAVTA